VWIDFRDRGATISDLDDADGVVGAAVVVSFLVTLAAIIVLSIWSLRTARNARNTGASDASDVSPGLACGGWYIPLANAIVPFVQLRRIAVHRHRPTSAVSLWQGLIIASGVFSGVARSVGQVDVDDGRDDVITKLTTESILAFVSAALLVAVTLAATRAMRDVDGDTTPRP
jgi:hypothetical protein